MAKSSNNLVNPNAREAMNRFKMEAASEDGVPTPTKFYTYYHLKRLPTCFCGTIYRPYRSIDGKRFPARFFVHFLKRRHQHGERI